MLEGVYQCMLYVIMLDTIHHTPYTIHHTPYTLYHIPYILYTLYPIRIPVKGVFVHVLELHT
jgi:hypothetical protein